MDVRTMDIVRMDEEERLKLIEAIESKGGKSPFHPLSEKEARQLESMPKAKRKNWMRNKKCPCKSGKKFKNCCWTRWDRP